MGCCNHSLSWDCNKYGPLLDCSQAGSLWWLWRGSSHLYLACINYPENRIGRMFLISALQFACCGILPFQLLVINHESKFDGWAVQNSRNSLNHLTPYTPPPPPPTTMKQLSFLISTTQVWVFWLSHWPCVWWVQWHRLLKAIDLLQGIWVASPWDSHQPQCVTQPKLDYFPLTCGVCLCFLWSWIRVGWFYWALKLAPIRVV